VTVAYVGRQGARLSDGSVRRRGVDEVTGGQGRWIGLEIWRSMEMGLGGERAGDGIGKHGYRESR